MIDKISINNFKSINSLDIELGRINVFIGENGSGKSNILESLLMFSASKTYDLNSEDLFNRGMRVTKPSLTFNSFLGQQVKKIITINAEIDGYKLNSKLTCNNNNDIQANWIDQGTNYAEEYLTQRVKDKVMSNIIDDIGSIIDLAAIQNGESPKFDDAFQIKLKGIVDEKAKVVLDDEMKGEYLRDYVIYNINTNALRGISNDSKRYPLGINGEGLDVLISSFTEDQLNSLKQTKFISWLKDIHIDNNDSLKIDGYKIGRSNSKLYFTDRFMQKKNNLFAAENANEGALHILFYIALFVSDETPKFFAIDNIENALNPLLCRMIIAKIAELSKQTNKQCLITTHNPAVIDGLNLHDDNQRLFVVKRTDEGYTKVERIKLKPNIENESLKLSELWMRGYLGGLPSNIF